MGEEEGRRKRLGESRRTKRPDADPLPDLSAFMNDRFFFGDAVNFPQNPSQNRDLHNEDDEEEEEEEEKEEEEEEEEVALNQKGINGINNSTSRSRQTQEWLEEARQIVSSSPARRSFHSHQSPGPSILNYARHEHLSRSARRSVDSSPLSASLRLDSRPNLPSSRFNGAPNSITSDSRPNFPSSRFSGAPNSVTSDKENSRSENHAQNWFGNILKKESRTRSQKEEFSVPEKVDSRLSRPPLQGNEGRNTLGDVLKQKKYRNGGKEENRAVGALSPPRRSMHTNGGKEENRAVGALSPPRRSMRNNGVKEENHDVGALSPPRRSMHIHVRSSSASTYCGATATPRSGFGSQKKDVSCLNNFLKKQRDRVKGGASGHAKIVLSPTTSSTSSMVATIGYAWLLAEIGEVEAVPVMNMKRIQMRGEKQAAWLFHHVGIDARSLLFADEVDMESFSGTRKVNVIMIGQDALHMNTHDNDHDEAVSPCTLLIDEYYQRGYKLLEVPYLRKLLLAGILLDTENSFDRVKRKDARAIDLLLIDASPDHKNNLLHLLNEKHKDDTFEEVLRSNYGEHVIKVKSQPMPTSSSGGKNIIVQTLSKWFGFGSK